MKRILALITVCAFVAVLAGMAYAQDDRSAAEKLASGRAYLKLLDGKIIKHRKLGNTAIVKDLQGQKKSTLARMQGWKAEMEAGEGAAPVAPAPPPPPVARRPAPAAPSAGLFGLGLNTGYTVGYIMAGGSNTAISGRADLILGDPLALGPIVGLSENAVEWKIGLGGATGKGTNGSSQKAVALFVDGILNVPADLLGGIESYLGGDFNYVLYRSGGSWGGAVYYGIQGDIGLGGKSYAELSYGLIRPSATSMRGLGINVGTKLVL